MPAITKVKAITPIVFWASLEPCPRDIKPTKGYWSILRNLLNRGVSEEERLQIQNITRVNSQAIPRLNIGARIKTANMIPTLCQLTGVIPQPATNAPINPPISAWDEEDGIPQYKVTKFQVIAPHKAQIITTTPDTPT